MLTTTISDFRKDIRRYLDTVTNNFFSDLKLKEESAQFILFIDALRYDLAKKLIENLKNKQYKTTFASQFIL